MKVCILLRGAAAIACPANSTSLGLALDNEQIVELRTTCAIDAIASKSPGELAAKPASITSTPIRSSNLAMRNLSWADIVAPGLCSPSLRVVSNMMSLSLVGIVI